MPEHEVVAVSEATRDWKSKAASGDQNDMRSYRIDLKKPDGSVQQRVELAQKITTAAPTVGQKLDGDIETRQWGENNEKTDYKFKKAARGGGGFGGGGRAWKPRPDDAPPVWSGKQAQIVAQHSQNMALRVLELAAQIDAPDGAPDGVDKVGTLMRQLGIKTTVAKERCPGCGQLTEAESDGAEVDTIDLGLVDAFSLHANEAFERAWAREERASKISNAMKESA